MGITIKKAVAAICVLLIIALLLLSMVAAQDCEGDSCALNQTVKEDVNQSLPNNYEEDCEIDCENFEWIQEYIQEEVILGKINGNQVGLMNLLMQANYGLQDDLDSCSAELNMKAGYTIITFVSLAFALLMLLWRIKDRMSLQKNGYKI